MHTWDDAARLWLVEKKHKADIDRDTQKLEWLKPYFGGKPLAQIDREAVMAVAWDKAKATSPATANRLLALIRAIFRRACRVWEWIDRMPFVELFPEPEGRVRSITPEQARALFNEQIVSGVVDAQKEVADKGASVNPSGLHLKSDQIKGHAITNDGNVTQHIEFDVAVTTTEGTGTKGGIGVVAGVLAP